MPRTAPFSEADLRAAVGQGQCWADVLRFLGYGIRGHNYRTVQKWVAHWQVSTEHFNPRVRTARAAASRQLPLEDVMVEHSTYKRGELKRRLLKEGIKQSVCEMCGQGEIWLERRMSMILDHINGVSDDHRLENLRILCPNCNATLDTHCGRNTPRERVCPGCNQIFVPSSNRHRYCSSGCWGKIAAAQYEGIPHPETRKVERPSYEQLLVDVSQMSLLAIGRKYGVSDNGVRKWLRWYQAQAARAEAQAEAGAEDLAA